MDERASPTGATAERRRGPMSTIPTSATAAVCGPEGVERAPSPLAIHVNTAGLVPPRPGLWFTSPQRGPPVGPLTTRRLVALFAGVVALFVGGTIYRVSTALPQGQGGGVVEPWVPGGVTCSADQLCLIMMAARCF